NPATIGKVRPTVAVRPISRIRSPAVLNLSEIRSSRPPRLSADPPKVSSLLLTWSTVEFSPRASPENVRTTSGFLATGDLPADAASDPHDSSDQPLLDHTPVTELPVGREQVAAILHKLPDRGVLAADPTTEVQPRVVGDTLAAGDDTGLLLRGTGPHRPLGLTPPHRHLRLRALNDDVGDIVERDAELLRGVPLDAAKGLPELPQTLDVHGHVVAHRRRPRRIRRLAFLAAISCRCALRPRYTCHQTHSLWLIR